MQPPRAMRSHLGLRSQILLALSVAFALAFGLFGVALVRITQRARLEDRLHDVQAASDVLAAALAAAPQDESGRAAFVSLSEAVLGRAGVRGVELGRDPLEPWVRGVTGLGRSVDATLPDGRQLRLWVRAPEVDTAPHRSLVLGYVSVTGGLILLLTYIFLTTLIVRPVDALTRAATRLAEGRLEREVPVRGAREMAELAVSFNRMATQLEADRLALEGRLNELEATTAQLESAQAQVVRAERLASVGRLAAGVAHEIGNPLAAVLGLLELLREGDLDEQETEEFLARVQRETERMHQIIRDLLEFSRHDSRHDSHKHSHNAGAPGEAAATAPQSADLIQVSEEALSLLAPQKDTSGVEFIRSFEADCPAVLASSDACTQIVLNLLLNSVDALQGQGRVKVSVERDPVSERVLLSVCDSGPGIPAELREHLFEPFVTSKRAGEGTGLGLAVVHGLVERFDGEILADDATEEDGGGARFRVWLPISPPSPP